MSALILLFIFIFGACIGSFLNVLIWRVPQKLDFIKARSVCTACGEKIKAYDLMPIISYMALGAKCRSCRSKIPLRYPLIEAAAGGLFLAVWLRFGFTLQAAAAVFAASVLLVVAVIDLNTKEIPNGLVIALAVPAVAAVFLFPEIGLASRIIGFFAISLPMYLLALIIENAFGGGDVKLMAVCGFLLGWQSTLLAFFIALLFGGGYGIWLLSRKASGKQTIAFGPYLCLGVFTALLFGGEIINWYVNLMF